MSLSSELAAVLQCGCILGLSREGIGEHRCSSENCPCVPCQAGAVPESLPGSLCQCCSRREFMEGDPAIASSTHAQGLFVKVGKKVRNPFMLQMFGENVRMCREDISKYIACYIQNSPHPKAHLHLSIHSTWSYDDRNNFSFHSL